MAVSAAGLFLFLAANSIWVSHYGPSQLDFVSLSAAAKLAIEGSGALAYDASALHVAELSAGSIEGLSFFRYPPPFLFALLPFGLLSFPYGWGAWLLCTSGLYLLSARRITNWSYSLAQPGAIATPLNGQTGLLTAGLFVLGTSALDRRPFLAGGILALLIIKPQLVLLIPVALVAGRHWSAVAGAALSSLALVLTSLALFGEEAFRGFLSGLPDQADLLSEGSWAWFQLVSPYAAVRSIGVNHAAALVLQGVIAVGAAAIVWRAWAIGHAHRTELLAAGSVLVSPYLFIYDTALLVLPFVALVRLQRPYASAAVWALCAAPLLGYTGLYGGPNTTPFAAILSICALYGRLDFRSPFWLKADLRR